MKYHPVRQYFFNILIGLDQLANVVFFLGDPDETVSSHIGRVKIAGGIPRRRFVMRALDWFLETTDADHSIEAIEPEGADGLIDHPRT